MRCHNHHRFPGSRLLGVLGTALALTVGLPAQKAVRTPVPPAVEPRAPAPDPLPPLLLVPEQQGTVPVGDLPDFAPMEAYEDGLHTRLRLRGNPYVLSFTGGDIVPEPGFDERLLAAQRAQPTGTTYAYVMLEGRMAEAKIEALRALGLGVLDVHTWQSVVVRLPLARLQDVARLPFVRWIGYPAPEQKLGVPLARLLREVEARAPHAAAPNALPARIDVQVSLYESELGAGILDGIPGGVPAPVPAVVLVGEAESVGEVAIGRPTSKLIPNGPVQRALEALGFETTFYERDVFILRGTATPAQVRAMQALDVVRTIELTPVLRTAHDQSMAMIGQDRVRGTWPGNGVPVGIIDTGLDASPWHSDFAGKGFVGWVSHASLPGVWADGNGHGTHVAGTVFGRGLVDQRYTGAAPGVGNGGEGDRIFIGRLLDDNGDSKGNPKVLYDAFKEDFAHNGRTNPKRRLVSCSWGSADPDGYAGTEAESRTIDDIVWDNNQTYVFAAGNKDGIANWWAGQPAAAKNVLTVGSVSDHWGNIQRPGLAASSTRHGTTDGRAKPEICAPGDALTSTGTGASGAYRTMSGTSMATPTVAGAIASLMQRDSNFVTFPAAVKAAVVATGTNDASLSYESQRGYGILDAYKLNHGGKSSLTLFGSTLTQSGSWAYADIPIRSDLRAIRVTLVMIEPNASALASQARRNDVRLFVDTPPYSGAGNAGEFSKSSSHETVISHSSYTGAVGGLAELVKGQTVRIKVWAESISALDDVKYAVSVLQYFKDPNSAIQPTLEVTPERYATRPGQTLAVEATLRAHQSATDFSHARLWTTGPWPTLELARTTTDGLLHAYTSANNHPSANFPWVASSLAGGMTVGAGDLRGLGFLLQVPNSPLGFHTITFAASWDQGDAVHSATRGVRLCVDNQAPKAIANLASSTHTVLTWSNKDQITFTFDEPEDNGCAGVDKVFHTLSLNAATTPTLASSWVEGDATSAQVQASTSTAGQWFTVRPYDHVEYWGPTRSIGPFFVDTVVPTLHSVIVNDGAQYTYSTLVNVKLPYAEAHSGIDGIRYSMNGSSWSAWEPHSSHGQVVVLSNLALGGHANEGQHTVWAQIRDAAGNVSAVKTGGIDFRRLPKLTAATIASLPCVNADYYRLEGENLHNTEAVLFGPETVTTKRVGWHDSSWVNGSFIGVGTDVLLLYPPQGMRPIDYQVRIRGLSGDSNALTLRVTSNPAPVVRSAKTMISGSHQTLMVSRAGMPDDVTTIIVASTSNQPSVLQGVLYLDIGRAFTSYLLLPQIAFNAATDAAQIGFPVGPEMVGHRLYFQACFLHTTTQQPWPVPVSDVWSTNYIQFQ